MEYTQKVEEMKALLCKSHSLEEQNKIQKEENENLNLQIVTLQHDICEKSEEIKLEIQKRSNLTQKIQLSEKRSPLS